jgi:[ribosomal protein S5]-alanine N-acetyltransferase
LTETETILETERLSLRKWTGADCEALFEIMRAEAVARHIGDGKPFTIQKTKDFLIWVKNYEQANGFCRWKVVERSSGKTIGSCGFAVLLETGKIDLGYLLAQAAWGKGYATEIAAATIDYGFKKLGFREIIAMTDKENSASQKVLEKIGFTRLGIEVSGGEENLVYIKKKFDD